MYLQTVPPLNKKLQMLLLAEYWGAQNSYGKNNWYKISDFAHSQIVYKKEVVSVFEEMW